MCGVIFDAGAARAQIAALEVKISDPNFWNDQSTAQSLLQQRKQLEERVNAETSLASRASDLDTYIHLAQEESDAAQRDSILEDLSKELATADEYVAGLETKTLMSGESDVL
ncbi:MAG TPA: PCRF domain-containing protein, partial [Candidatus Acidoferrales bacterium]